MRPQPRPGHRLAGRMAREHAVTLGLHQPQALVHLVHDRDRGRPRGLARCRRVAVALEVEVEARHPRALARRPGAGPDGGHRHPRGRHPGLLRAGDDEVEAPLVHRERHRTQRRDRVDEDQGLGRRGPHRRRQRRNVVGHAGRRLVVRQQHGPEAGDRSGQAPHLGRLGRPAPLDLEPRHRCAVDLGDLREPVAERADRDGQHRVARRQRVDDRGLEARRSRAGQHDHVAARAEEGLHALAHAAQQRLELLATVVDHLAPAGLADGRGEAGRPGDAEVRLEAAHGGPPDRGGCRTDGGGGDTSRPPW